MHHLPWEQSHVSGVQQSALPEAEVQLARTARVTFLSATIHDEPGSVTNLHVLVVCEGFLTLPSSSGL